MFLGCWYLHKLCSVSIAGVIMISNVQTDQEKRLDDFPVTKWWDSFSDRWTVWELDIGHWTCYNGWEGVVCGQDEIPPSLLSSVLQISKVQSRQSIKMSVRWGWPWQQFWLQSDINMIQIHLKTQWAAVMTQRSEMRAPPQEILFERRLSLMIAACNNKSWIS